MHWMPILAEAYILNKVREAREEREEREQNIEETRDQPNQQENAADAQA